MSNREGPSPSYVDQDGAPVYTAPELDIPEEIINADEFDIRMLSTKASSKPYPKTREVSSNDEAEYTGKSVSYYRVMVTNPTHPELPPYEAECNDIIEALQMSFAEGNAFKAIWRRCAARALGKVKKGYDDGLYDAEKVVFFGERMVAIEKGRKS